METSFDDAMDSRQLSVTPRRSGDSPVRQVQKKNIALNLPDWQPISLTEPTEDSPIAEVAPSDLVWSPVASQYQDQQPVIESPLHVEQKSDISSQPINWDQLEKPAPKSMGDSPILQVRKKNIAVGLPDWQPVSATEPSGDSPVTEVAASDIAWPQVVTEYPDQQPIDEAPVHAEQKSDISSQPVNWEQLDKPVTTAPPASFPNVTKQIIEGEMYETEEKNETSEQAEDGSDCLVRRLVTTRRQLLPIAELTLEDGVEVSRTTSDVVVTVHVDEVVDILPPGVDNPHADGLETKTSVKESEEPLETGGTLKRRVTTTTVRRLQAPEISRKPEDWQPHHPAGTEVMQDGKNREND